MTDGSMGNTGSNRRTSGTGSAGGTDTTGELVIRARNLTRYFGRKAAVRGLDLAVPRGSVFGFLGRNGSGKTTTIRMLLGLLDPTRGFAEVLGHDGRSLPSEVLGRIGYLTEGHPVIAWMRVRDLGRFQSRFHARWNEGLFRSVTGHFRLDPLARAGDPSRGERAGLCLALTLAPEPELLILDDPAIGLDPVARRSLLEAMVHFTHKEGRTIFFSSHLLSDVERVADHMAILDGGVLRAHCAVETFRSRVKQYVLRFAGAPPAIPRFPGLLQIVPVRSEARVTVVNAGEGPPEALWGLGAAAIEEAPLSLEEALLSYLGARGEKRLFLDGVEGATDAEDAA